MNTPSSSFPKKYPRAGLHGTPPVSSETPKSWDPKWEDVFSSQPWGKYPDLHVVRFVARNFYKAKPRSSIRLLDLGAGPGACTWYMAREGFSVSAIEGSKTAIAQCRTRLENEGLSAELVVGDFISLPWPDDTFDGVIDNATLYCNSPKNCAIIAREVHRVLKPGGKFNSSNFTQNTLGFGTGDKVDRNTFTNITCGPLEGKGRSLFMDEQDIAEIYGCFSSRSVETFSFSLEENTKKVENWVITATK